MDDQWHFEVFNRFFFVCLREEGWVGSWMSIFFFLVENEGTLKKWKVLTGVKLEVLRLVQVAYDVMLSLSTMTNCCLISTMIQIFMRKVLSVEYSTRTPNKSPKVGGR